MCHDNKLQNIFLKKFKPEKVEAAYRGAMWNSYSISSGFRQFHIMDVDKAPTVSRLPQNHYTRKYVGLKTQEWRGQRTIK